MYVSDEFRLVFLAQPRTASRAVVELLKKELGFVLVNQGTGKFRSGHHSAGKQYVRKYQRRGYTAFTVARNHWDAIVSWWHQHSCNQPWPAFLHYWMHNQSTGYVQPHRFYWFFQPMADVVVDYDDLDAGISRLLGFQVVIPKIGCSTRVHYSHYYTRDQAELVAEYYADEIASYGFTYEAAHDCETLCADARAQRDWAKKVETAYLSSDVVTPYKPGAGPSGPPVIANFGEVSRVAGADILPLLAFSP